MAKYKYLLWDIDGTILDFEAAEAAAIRTLFKKYRLGDCSNEMLRRYSKINKKYWEALERGEMTKPEILVGRFTEFLSSEGLDNKIAASFNADYQLALGDTIVSHDDALNLVKYLKGKYIQPIITNGTRTAQEKKLSLSGLNQVMDYIFISEIIGYEKPSLEFFKKVISTIGINDLSQALIIGDSLTSDIQGGKNAGIDTCWYNFRQEENRSTLNPTYTISDLHDLLSIIR